MMGAILRHTASVCPVCLKQIPAQLAQGTDGVYLQKKCPYHGHFETPIWRDLVSLSKWMEQEPALRTGENRNCPHACGLCADHLRNTCCILLPVTSQCNLNCPHCFAASDSRPDPSFEQLHSDIQALAVPGKTLLQLSGGEPTCRKDLPDIIRTAKAAGCRYVQLNSNGIRLGLEDGYAEELRAAGLSFVFMQFDGLEDGVYRALRGRELLEIKKRAIKRCGAAGLGVTLVPMLVPGVNTGQVGALIRFAVENAPVVRGIHFQPVSYFSSDRIPDTTMRYTLDTLMLDIERQTDGLIRREDLLPSHCDHPRCGFHADFMAAPEGLVRLSRPGRGGCCETDPAEQNRQFVARRWERDPALAVPDNIKTLDNFLQRIRTHGFTLTAMAFMDAGNLDIERLRKCSLHVYDHGRTVPFCAYYLARWSL